MGGKVAVKWCVCVRLPACRGRSVTVKRGRGAFLSVVCPGGVRYDARRGRPGCKLCRCTLSDSSSNPGDYCVVRRLDVPTYGSNPECLETPFGTQCIRTVLAAIGSSRRDKVKMMSGQVRSKCLVACRGVTTKASKYSMRGLKKKSTEYSSLFRGPALPRIRRNLNGGDMEGVLPDVCFGRTQARFLPSIPCQQLPSELAEFSHPWTSVSA